MGRNNPRKLVFTLATSFLLPLAIAQAQQQPERSSSAYEGVDPATPYSDKFNGQKVNPNINPDTKNRYNVVPRRVSNQRSLALEDQNKIATLAPALAVRAPADSKHHQRAVASAGAAGLVSPQPARSLDDWEVEDFVLLATIDGTLYGTERKTGKTLWNINAESPMVQTTHFPHPRDNVENGDDDHFWGDNESMHATTPSVYKYVWTVEPREGGRVYIWTPGGLVPTGMTMKAIVEDMAPFAEEHGDPPVTYTGQKTTDMITIDASNGRVIKWFGHAGDSQMAPGDSCKYQSQFDNECGSRGTFTLGRNQYTVSIQDHMSGLPVARIVYSEWVLNQANRDLAEQHPVPRNKHVITGRHDGMVYSFDQAKNESEPLFNRMLPSPVACVFDVFRPKESADQNPDLLVLPQPVPIPLEDPATTQVREASVFLNCTEDGGWYALPGRDYPLIMTAPRASVSKREALVSDMWDHADTDNLFRALVGTHFLPSSHGKAGTSELPSLPAGSGYSEQEETLFLDSHDIDGLTGEEEGDMGHGETTTDIAPRDPDIFSWIIDNMLYIVQMALQSMSDLVKNPLAILVLIYTAYSLRFQIRDLGSKLNEVVPPSFGKGSKVDTVFQENIVQETVIQETVVQETVVREDDSVVEAFFNQSSPTHEVATVDGMVQNLDKLDTDKGLELPVENTGKIEEEPQTNGQEHHAGSKVDNSQEVPGDNAVAADEPAGSPAVLEDGISEKQDTVTLEMPAVVEEEEENKMGLAAGPYQAEDTSLVPDNNAEPLGPALGDNVASDAVQAPRTANTGPTSRAVTFAEDVAAADADHPTKRKARRGKRGGIKHRKGPKNAPQREASQSRGDEPLLDVDQVVKRAKQIGSEVTQQHVPDLQTVGGNPEEINQPIIKLGNLEVNTDEKLGTGSNGTVVFAGRFDGRDVAVKRMLIQFYDIASQETSLLRQSDDHPNVIRYYSQHQTGDFLYIALELCQASLAEVVERPLMNKKLAELGKRYMQYVLCQVAEGLCYLHDLRIVHRDLKPHNILINVDRDGKPRPLVSDFGLCKRLEGGQSSFGATTAHAAGTSGWRAPELLVDDDASSNPPNHESVHSGTSLVSSDVLPGRRVTRAIDIFSLGLVYYYVLTEGQHPFDCGDRYMREVNIRKGRYDLTALDRLGDESSEARQLIGSMLDANPKSRPTARHILAHPFFWKAKKRLAFLCDVSDHFEKEPREPPSHRLQLLEATALRVIPLSGFLFELPNQVVDSLGRQRKYTKDRMLDLLRAIRNKKHHYEVCVIILSFFPQYRV